MAEEVIAGSNRSSPKNSDPVTTVLKDADYPAWDRFVSSAGTGSIYSTAAYLRILCATAGGRFRIICVRKGPDIQGGVALYEQDSRFGPFVTDRRLLYYNGIVLRDYDTKYPSVRTSRLIDTCGLLADHLATLGLGNIRIKSRHTFTDPRVFLQKDWSLETAFSYVVAIADLKQARDRVEQNLRRLIDRCAAQGMTVTDDDDFDRFFYMHEGTAGRKGAPLYLPRGAFEQYFSQLKQLNLIKLLHARLPDGKSVAAQLVLLGSHPCSHTVSAAADPEYLKTGASAFLRWKTFEILSQLGYQDNDLTDATLNPVTHFKSQLGGRLVCCHVLSSPESPKFRFGRRLAQTIQQLRGRRV